MTRSYEAVYIFDSTLEDAAINEKLDRFHLPVEARIHNRLPILRGIRRNRKDRLHLLQIALCGHNCKRFCRF